MTQIFLPPPLKIHDPSPRYFYIQMDARKDIYAETNILY